MDDDEQAMEESIASAHQENEMLYQMHHEMRQERIPAADPVSADALLVTPPVVPHATLVHPF